jgi:transketolase
MTPNPHAAGWTDPLDAEVVAHARVLPLDVVQAKGNGHAGTAVSLTPALYLLFQEVLRHDPAEPTWPGRDRFVLSAGHASLALYLQLFLCGYGVEVDDLRKARTLGSLTPGHPEYGHTPGVETTTGPLGQGLATAVGMALGARRLRGLLDPDAPAGQSPFDHRIWCVAGDGDLQEGISHEAGALAGVQRLGALTVVWDDNRISIEGDTAVATAEDVPARFAAYGWRVVDCADAEDPAQVRAAFAAALEPDADGERPTFIRLRTRIGHPMPTVGGTAAAHSGAPGADEVAATKAALGLDPEQSFSLPQHLLDHARRVIRRGDAARAQWQQSVAAWRASAPADRVALYDRLHAAELPAGWADTLPRFPAGSAPVATRVASNKALVAVADQLPELWGGSADLVETNGMLVPHWRSVLAPGVTSEEWPGGPYGELLHFGIREHAMAAIANGILLDGPTRPVVATFFVFSDYLRPALRLSALMRLPAVHVWTHDSVALGEDGPTHQPVEHLWAARAMPRLAVVRPADANETTAAWMRTLQTRDRPTALVLSRQALPVLGDPEATIAGALRGGYVVAPAEDDVEPTSGAESTPDVLLLATGSEVSVAVSARARLATLGVSARVVSLPCLEWFEAEPQEYRDAVLPPAVAARVSVEAGTAQGWWRYLGTSGEAVSVEDFGASGDGQQVLAACGVSVEAVVDAALRSHARVTGEAAARLSEATATVPAAGH